MPIAEEVSSIPSPAPPARGLRLAAALAAAVIAYIIGQNLFCAAPFTTDENSYVFHVGIDALGDFYPEQVDRIVQRRKAGQAANLRFHAIVHDDRLFKCFSAVHDPVGDNINLMLLLCFKHAANRILVFVALDLLQVILGNQFFARHGVKLVLNRGAAAVQYEHVLFV